MSNALTIFSLLGVGIIGVYIMSTTNTKTTPSVAVSDDQGATRGVRNNNPGNIRYSVANNWRGQIGVDDAGFVIFDTSENGIRAIARILKNDILSDRPTIRLLIDEWAPPEDNNPTSDYALFVSQRTGIPLDEHLIVEQLPGIVSAVIYFENGVNPYSDYEIRSGVALA